MIDKLLFLEQMNAYLKIGSLTSFYFISSRHYGYLVGDKKDFYGNDVNKQMLAYNILVKGFFMGLLWPINLPLLLNSIALGAPLVPTHKRTGYIFTSKYTEIDQAYLSHINRD